MGMYSYYLSIGYSKEIAARLANPPVSRPSNSRARKWFKKGAPVETVPDKLLQSGTRAKVGRKPVYFTRPKTK